MMKKNIISTGDRPQVKSACEVVLMNSAYRWGYRFLFYTLFSSVLVSCSLKSQQGRAVFTFNTTDQGIELLENNNPVFFYQRQPKSLAGEFVCNNYLHPLYSLTGDTLTEEFPASHPHHRGVFWAWHQVYIGQQHVGDSWIMKDVLFDIVKSEIDISGQNAKLNLVVRWKSPLFRNGSPFLEEHTLITVRKQEKNIRMIDFDIVLKPLVTGVQLGGSEEKEKGYGGFSARIKTPPGLVFTSSEGLVTPKEGQVRAGAVMDFSANFGGDDVSGLTILCHPSNLNHPAPWILRQSESMQNTVFPGADRIELPFGKLLPLHYRMIVHKGNANNIDLDFLQAEYERTRFKG